MRLRTQNDESHAPNFTRYFSARTPFRSEAVYSDRRTRVTVECILERLGAGETINSIVAEHPRLTRQTVLAAVEFAARALRADVIYPVAGNAA